VSSSVGERPRIDWSAVRRPTLPWNLNPIEIVAAVFSITVFSLAVFYYFSALKPEQARLRQANEQLKAQQDILLQRGSGGSGAAKQLSTTEIAKAEKDSLETFQGNWLRPPGQGRIAIIDEINGLARKNNMVLSSGIEMRSGGASQADTEKSGSRKKKDEDVLDVFPRAQIQFTVIGQYSDLRRFIDEIEHTKQFLVINSVGLTSIEPKFGARGGKAGGGMAPVMASGAAGVSLTLGMTAYFRS